MSGKKSYMGLLVHGKRGNGRKFQAYINLDVPLQMLVVDLFEEAKKEVELQLGEVIEITSINIKMVAPPV